MFAVVRGLCLVHFPPRSHPTPGNYPNRIFASALLMVDRLKQPREGRKTKINDDIHWSLPRFESLEERQSSENHNARGVVVLHYSAAIATLILECRDRGVRIGAFVAMA